MSNLEKLVITVIYLSMFTLILSILNDIAFAMDTNVFILIGLLIASVLITKWILK